MKNAIRFLKNDLNSDSYYIIIIIMRYLCLDSYSNKYI